MKVLKKQLISAFESKYRVEIKDNYTGFNNITIQEIFTYLYNKYEALDEREIKKLYT